MLLPEHGCLRTRAVGTRLARRSREAPVHEALHGVFERTLPAEGIKGLGGLPRAAQSGSERCFVFLLRGEDEERWAPKGGATS